MESKKDVLKLIGVNILESIIALVLKIRVEDKLEGDL